MSVVAGDRSRGLIAKAAVVARLLVGAVLLISGLSKIMVPAEEFAMALEAYRLFPIPVIMMIARVVPWVELFSGGFLLLGLAVRYAATVAGGLFIAFIAALSSTLVRGIALEDCGCFGWALPHLPPSKTILLDCFLLALCVLILVDQERRFALERWLKRK